MEKIKALSRGKKAFVGAIFIGLVAFGLWQYQWRTEVNYYEVGTQSVESLIHVNAEVLPSESAWYTAQVGGVLTQVAVEKDSSVKVDDILYAVQPFDFMKKQTEIRTASDQLKSLSEKALDEKNKVLLSKAIERFEEQDRSLEQAWIAHNSVLDLFKKQMITSDAYKESLIQINEQLDKYLEEGTVFNESLKGISTTDQAFNEAVKNIDGLWSPAKALEALMKPKSDDGKTVVKPESLQLASFKSVKEGVVARITAEIGLYVPVGAPLMEVANPELARLQMEIPVTHLEKVLVGTELRTKLTDGTVVMGKINLIDKVITDQMQPDGSIIKLVKTYAALEKKTGYKFYTKATASIIANVAKDAVVIPKELVYEHNGQYSVWVNANGVLTEIPIKVQFETETLYVVASGVQSGDMLVMDTKLKLGQKIK